MGTPVGPTVGVAGLTYDEWSQALIGIASGSSDQTMYAIDPATGTFFSLGMSTGPTGWEGLTVLNPPGSLLSGPEVADGRARGAGCDGVAQSVPGQRRAGDGIRGADDGAGA